MTLYGISESFVCFPLRIKNENNNRWVAAATVEWRKKKTKSSCNEEAQIEQHIKIVSSVKADTDWETLQVDE